ncbi:MAG: DUF6338 family protein [Syntrophothermus sp.]
MSRFIVHPIGKPWDFIFQNKEDYWIIVNLKNGLKIGGKYDSKSFSSSFPYKEQIYIEEVWTLDDQNQFDKPIEFQRNNYIRRRYFIS